FDPPRYATRGIVGTLDPDLQFTLWAMVDVLRFRSGVKPDYLQVFELAPSSDPKGPLNQTIVHRQEQPPYQATNRLHVANPVSTKIFVIDDGENATMMLAEEY
ncbi:MAG: DUF960 domain-containing protein, partial [Alicyclobacillus sp.]|nr:DUF960 domain-containing protein [Alicyclobacillus sp.]